MTLLSVIALHLLFRLPVHRRPMYGDDFIGVRAAQMPVRSGSFGENIWLVGGGKWRPISTALMLFLGKLWGYSYAPFQQFNSVLIVLLALLASLICLKLSGSPISSLGVGCAVVVSEFNWFSQISIYGSMEILAIGFLLLAFYVSTKSDSISDESQIYASVFLLLLSSLCHERYIICSLIFVAYHGLRDHRAGVKLRSSAFLLIPAFHVIAKGLVLHIDPLAGGGESNFRNSFDWWIFAHFFDSVLMLLGWFSGVGRYYKDAELQSLASSVDLHLVGTGAFFAASVLVAVFIAVQRHRGLVTCRGNQRNEVAMFALGIAFACLIPASSVIERIEGRWMYASQIFVLLAVALILSNFKHKTSIAIALLLPLVSGTISVVNRYSVNNYTALRDQPTEILQELGTTAPRVKPWMLVISQRDAKSSVAWQFGYGDTFSQLPNPPYLVHISTNPDVRCSRVRTVLPCYQVVLDGLEIISRPTEVSRFFEDGIVR